MCSRVRRDVLGYRPPDLQQIDEPVDALRIAGAEIPDFTGEIAFRGAQKRRGDVGDEKKITALRAVTDHGERFAGKLLLEENAEHRAVSAGGAYARAVGIENADRIRRQPIDAVPMQAAMLALIFAAGRRDARARSGGLRGSEHRPSHSTMTMPHRRIFPRSQRARIQERAPCLGHWSPCSRSGARSTARCRRCRRNGRPARHLEQHRLVRLEPRTSRRWNSTSRIVPVMSEIGMAADQIVDHPHAISASHQQIHHVAADKPGAAGNDRNRTVAHRITA